MCTKPIVSIVVLSYNSEKTIKDTLDSIESQSYKKLKIEVIFCDDASEDQTRDIIDTWIKKNRSLYFNITRLFHLKNIGVSRNINSGAEKARGMWLKPIAADDILMTDCISSNIDYVNSNPNVSFLFSPIERFGAKTGLLSVDLRLFRYSAKYQYRTLLMGNFLPAPSSFLKLKVLKENEYFSTEIRNVEDYPSWIKYTRLGYKLDYNDKVVTVKYRISNSISQTDNNIVSNIVKIDNAYFKELMVRGFYKNNYILMLAKKVEFYIMNKFFDNEFLNTKKFHIIYLICIRLNVFRTIERLIVASNVRKERLGNVSKHKVPKS